MNDKQINFQKKTGIFLMITGAVLFTIPLQAQRSMPMSFSTIIIFLALGSIFVFIGGYINYRSRQYAAKNLAEKITSEHGEHDLLYLRPFTTDSTLNKSLHGANITTFYQNLQSSIEEDLFKVLEPFGNLIAIGKPGEKLPVPGAVRIYADEDWQNVVIDKMKKSQLVITHAGDGEGFNWEIKQAFEIVDPKKLLIFIPQMSKKKYEVFRQSALNNVGVSLPDKSVIKKAKAYMEMGFVRFTEEKTPYFLPLYAPLFRVNPYAPYRARFMYSLKPLFNEFGIKWQLPLFIKMYVVVLVFFGTAILLIIVLLILSSLGKI